jgi:aminopeptidase N
VRTAILAVGLAACGDNSIGPIVDPIANPARAVTDTQLHFDLAAMTATATITFAPSATPGASLEVGGLAIDTVAFDGQPLPATGTALLELGLPAADHALAVDIAYHWQDHEGFTGASAGGYTLIWPYYCSNLFPCHSDPSDGTTFSLDLANVPAQMNAVYPKTIAADAPAYQIAWAYNTYTEMDLGTTPAGTELSFWYLPGELASATIGSQHLAAAFDWFEQTLGPYRFGNHYGSVSVEWPAGAFGGMEHHPFSHIGSIAIGDETTIVHESAHGWFGDGIRIACWEDFVLSEGTVSYLAARALEVVAPDVATSTWAGYATELSQLSGTLPVWPQSCGQIDIIGDDLFSNAPYMRGAFFYKGIADKVGADKLDLALGTFYKQHAGGDATMQDMLDTIKAVTGYDPTACAQTWLLDLSSATPPTPAPCP